MSNLAMQQAWKTDETAPDYPPIPTWWVRDDDPKRATRYARPGAVNWSKSCCMHDLIFYPDARGIRPMCKEEAWEWYIKSLAPWEVVDNREGWDAHKEYTEATR